MGPTPLLATSVALFVAPAIYVFAASMLRYQGGAALSGGAETVIWAVGVASLLAPFAIAGFLRSSERATQLLLILVVTFAASVFGFGLSFTTGSITPVRALGIASMLAIFGWSWAYRECFRANRLDHVAPRYTTVLIIVGVVCLAFAAFRA